MANVADTKLYDILGVSPSASENELKKVSSAEREAKGAEVGTESRKKEGSPAKCGLETS